jgi:hypothetical protein
MRPLFIALSLVISLSALGQPVPMQTSPSDLFQRVRSRLLSDMDRQPRYTCVENITRQMFLARSSERRSCSALISAFDARKKDPPITSWDRLQLDVGIASNQEIHAWSGAPAFSEDEVRRFVGSPFGDGDFANFINGVFGGSAAVRFQGEHLLDGRRVFDYSYKISTQRSGYRIEAGSAALITAYSGSFVLDPQTTDIVELKVRTAELPEKPPVGCQVRNQIEYRRLDINGHQVLIPREARLGVIYRNGKESLNTIVFANCHEYSSKSVLRFDKTETGAGAAGSPQPVKLSPHATPFPAGLRFECRIVTPLDSDISGAGTSLDAILRSPIRARNGTVLAPRGARVHARLVRFAKYTQELDYFELVVHLESIEINGVDWPLYAAQVDPAPVPMPIVGNSLVAGRRDAAEILDLPPALPTDSGVFFFVREHIRLHQLDSRWITTTPRTN